MIAENRSVKFFLFRLVLEPHAKQRSFGELSIRRDQLIAKLLNLSPRYESSGHYIYLTSKITQICCNSGYYFKFGVITHKKGVNFDESAKDFIEFPKDETDYVHCLYDIKRQLLAIEKKNRLASPKSLANKLAFTLENMRSNEIYAQQLSTDEKMLLANSTCKVRLVYEPNEFIKRMRSAYRINSFKISMLLPNPIDFNDMIKKPLDLYMEDTGALGSSVTIENKTDGLEPERLISISRDISSYGAGAEAQIIDNENSKPTRLVLDKNENHASVELPFPQTMFTVHFKDHATHFLDRILTKYRQINEDKK